MTRTFQISAYAQRYIPLLAAKYVAGNTEASAENHYGGNRRNISAEIGAELLERFRVKKKIVLVQKRVGSSDLLPVVIILSSHRLASTRWKSMGALIHFFILGGLFQPALRFGASVRPSFFSSSHRDFGTLIDFRKNR